MNTTGVTYHRSIYNVNAEATSDDLCCYVACVWTVESDHGRPRFGPDRHSKEPVVPDHSGIQVAAQGNRVRIHLSGVVDIQAVPPLQAALTSALSAAPNSLHIDLAKITYLSLSAMGAILAAHDEAARSRTDVVVIDPPRTLRKLMENHGPASPIGHADGPVRASEADGAPGR